MIDLMLSLWTVAISVFDRLSEVNLLWTGNGSINLRSFILAVIIIGIVVSFLKILVKE